MTKLECSVENCNYNKNMKCCLDGIKVRGMDATTSSSTACGSFRDKKSGKFCDCNQEFASEPAGNSMIECEVEKCAYNSQRKCNAKMVDIEGNNAKSFEETRCDTFTTK